MTSKASNAADLSAPDLQVRLHQQGLVADFGRFALQTDDLQSILDQASHVAADGLDARFAKVLEYLPPEKAFLVRSGVGWKPGVVGHARVADDSQSPAGHAFKTGEPVVSNDLPTETRFRTPKLLLEHGVRSAINVLIKEDGNSFGVLEVDSTHRTEFGDADVAFLQTLANSLAAAIRAQQRDDARSRVLREKDALLKDNERLLREKDLLFREIHHRVTNSLQLVHTALTLQLKSLESPEARAHVTEAAARVLAIAAVHRRLYQGGSVVQGDAAVYLRRLLDDMTLLLSASGERSIEVDIESFQLSADDLAHLGLITVELVTNGLKHGRGNVKVVVRREDDSLLISVADDGAGFPENFDADAQRGLGLKMVSALARPAHGQAIVVDRSVPFGRIVVRTRLSGASRQG